MKKGKESTPIESFLGTFTVKQRTKKHPITIKGSIEIRKGAFIKGKHAFRKAPKRKIELKVTLSPSDWPKLWSYYLHYPSEFAEQFWSNLIHPAMMELETKKGARGRNKKAEQFVHWVKTEASFLYSFFSSWCKKPVEEWPDYLQTLIGMMKKDARWFDYVFKGQSGTNKPYKLTRYCIEKAYGEIIKSYRLKFFDDPKNFLKTYIYKNGRVKRDTKLFIEGKSPQELANLAYKPPLKNIFKRIQII